MVGNTFGLDEKELVTREMYDKTAEKWATTSDGVDAKGNYLWIAAMATFNYFASTLGRRKLNLLEVGSGTGRDSLLLCKLYNYTGTDVSEGFIKVSREKAAGELPADAFQQVSVYDLAKNFSPESFDLFWSCATLLHCSKDRMQEALGAIRAVVKTGAIGFISLKEGDGEELDHFDGHPRYFFYWRREEFEKELEQAGFKVLEFFVKPGRLNFLCFFVQRAV